MIHVTFRDFRDNIAAYLDRASDDRAPIFVVRDGGEAVVLLAASEYAGMTETEHLLGSAANRRELLASIAEADAGLLEEHDLAR